MKDQPIEEILDDILADNDVKLLSLDEKCLFDSTKSATDSSCLDSLLLESISATPIVEAVSSPKVVKTVIVKPHFEEPSPSDDVEDILVHDQASTCPPQCNKRVIKIRRNLSKIEDDTPCTIRIKKKSSWFKGSDPMVKKEAPPPLQELKVHPPWAECPDVSCPTESAKQTKVIKIATNMPDGRRSGIPDSLDEVLLKMKEKNLVPTLTSRAVVKKRRLAAKEAETRQRQAKLKVTSKSTQPVASTQAAEVKSPRPEPVNSSLDETVRGRKILINPHFKGNLPDTIKKHQAIAAKKQVHTGETVTKTDETPKSTKTAASISSTVPGKKLVEQRQPVNIEQNIKRHVEQFKQQQQHPVTKNNLKHGVPTSSNRSATMSPFQSQSSGPTRHANVSTGSLQYAMNRPSEHPFTHRPVHPAQLGSPSSHPSLSRSLTRPCHSPIVYNRTHQQLPSSGLRHPMPIRHTSQPFFPAQVNPMFLNPPGSSGQLFGNFPPMRNYFDNNHPPSHSLPPHPSLINSPRGFMERNLNRWNAPPRF